MICFSQGPKPPYPLLLPSPGQRGSREEREEEVPNTETRRSIGFRFEERKGQEWGQERKNANNEQANKGVSKGGASELPSSPPSPAPFSTACSQLHTINCEVHPGAVSRIIFGAVLVQEEHPALVPALVFCSEPFNLKRCPLLQPDSPWRRSPESGCFMDP